MHIELTEKEAQVLINLIDIAVKSAGLQAAEPALHFVTKIKAALDAESDEGDDAA